MKYFPVENEESSRVPSPLGAELPLLDTTHIGWDKKHRDVLA